MLAKHRDETRELSCTYQSENGVCGAGQCSVLLYSDQVSDWLVLFLIFRRYFLMLKSYHNPLSIEVLDRDIGGSSHIVGGMRGDSGVVVGLL